MQENPINLAQLPRELARLTGGNPPAYRDLYQRVLNGQIPAESVNGRWYVAAADLPSIAAALGLTAENAAA